MHLFLSTDANPAIGSGHLMRCLILAQAFREAGGEPYFFLRDTTPAYQQMLEKRGFAYRLLTTQQLATPEVLHAQVQATGANPNESFLLTDSDFPPFYTPDFQQTVRATGLRLGMIVFGHENVFFHADLLHNQNLLALNLPYQTAPHTRKLLGTQFAILKPEYAALQAQVTDKPRLQPEILLINFGGGDPVNRTERLLRLSDAFFADTLRKIYVVVGGLYPHLDSLKKTLAQTKTPAELFVNTPRMPELMAAADWAITAGGLTAWELASLRTLNLLIPNSERERQSAEGMDAQGVVFYPGDTTVSDQEVYRTFTLMREQPEICAQKVARFRELVATDGTQKVIQAIREILCRR